jgi:multidrug transporter EmrE-like cation transporter
MTASGSIQLALSTLIFLVAATCAKSWAVSASNGKLVLTIALYSVGNLIMLRLVREFGMASAFSLSAIIQLIAINLIAVMFFGERLTYAHCMGILLAVASVIILSLASAQK